MKDKPSPVQVCLRNAKYFKQMRKSKIVNIYLINMLLIPNKDLNKKGKMIMTSDHEWKRNVMVSSQKCYITIFVTSAKTGLNILLIS